MAKKARLFRCWATWSSEGWSYFSSLKVASEKAHLGYSVQEWDEGTESFVPWN